MNIRLLLVAGENKRHVDAAVEAAEAAFPGAAVDRAGSLKEAIGRAVPLDPEILVLMPPDSERAAEAAQALDGHRLPRWAVVAMDESDPAKSAAAIPEAEWNPAVLARTFRSALALHLMHRERERLRGDLLSVGIRITHDLRTPVGGIISSTEVLESGAPAGAKPEKSLTRPIIESANDVARIISQLTLLAKATARAAPLQRFNMATPVARALDRVEMKVREKGASIAKPKSWPEVMGDAAHSEAVWVALLENAVRHSGKAPKIEIGWEPAGEAAKFWVRDSGAGIAPDKRRLLFHPFHRLHEPNAPHGLGLSVVERLVRLQGGHCGYEAAAPSGASFFFTLDR